MADTVSFYFFSRGVERSVHRPVKNREERITLGKLLERSAAFEELDRFERARLVYIRRDQEENGGERAASWSLEDFFRPQKPSAKLLNDALNAILRCQIKKL